MGDHAILAILISANGEAIPYICIYSSSIPATNLQLVRC